MVMSSEEKLFCVLFVVIIVSFSLGFTSLEPRTRFAIDMDVALIVSMILSSIKKKKKAIEDKKAQEKLEKLELFVKWLKEQEDGKKID